MHIREKGFYMAIKNWTVKTKQIKKKSKGLINHFNYLLDKKRDGHFYSQIVDLNGSPDRLKTILDEIEERKKYRQENGLRGGGVTNLATSFVLSLPRDIKQPTQKEWKRIAANTLKKLADDLDIPFEKIRDRSVVVLHDESNSTTKSSHLHILVGNVIDGKVIKPISQYQGTYSMKLGFNKAVKRVLNEDNNLYVAMNENVGDKPLFAARAEKAEKERQEINAKNKKLENKYNAMKSSLSAKKMKLSNQYKSMKKLLKQEKSNIEEAKSAFEQSISYARKIINNWIISIRSDQEDIEIKAKNSAKVIVDMQEKLPEVASDLIKLAEVEEGRADAISKLRDEFKVTHHVTVAQEQSDRKRRRRKRP